MKKVIKLTETDLTRIVKRVIKENRRTIYFDLEDGLKLNNIVKKLKNSYLENGSLDQQVLKIFYRVADNIADILPNRPMLRRTEEELKNMRSNLQSMSTNQLLDELTPRSPMDQIHRKMEAYNEVLRRGNYNDAEKPLDKVYLEFYKIKDIIDILNNNSTAGAEMSVETEPVTTESIKRKLKKALKEGDFRTKFEKQPHWIDQKGRHITFDPDLESTGYYDFEYEPGVDVEEYEDIPDDIRKELFPQDQYGKEMYNKYKEKHGKFRYSRKKDEFGY